MKYLLKAARKNHMIYIEVIEIILLFLYTYVEAQILRWTSDTISNQSIHYINLVILGDVGLIVINAVIGWMAPISRSELYNSLSEMFMTKVIHSDYQMYSEHSPGELSNIHSKCTSISSLFKTLRQIISGIGTFMINLIVIYQTNSEVLIPIIGVTAVLTIVEIVVLNKWMKLETKKHDLVKKKDVYIDELINGYAEVRSSTTEKFHLDVFHKTYDDIMSVIRKEVKYDIGIDSTVLALYNTVSVLVLVYMLNLVIQGKVTNTMAITMVTYALRMLSPISMIIGNMSEIGEQFVSLKKYSEIMDYKNSVIDGTIKLDTFNQDIVLDNVSFAYDTSNDVLRNVSLTIKKGEHVGICGSSGAGKSTLLKLLSRFYDVTSGEIRVDGFPVKQLTLQSLRSHIGIVQQDPYIFNNTIEYNIKYGSPDATREEVILACKRVALYDFIKTLPDKFETNVGPKGLKLSGGQKQRIALARIFLANPDIILLDEATSGLDNTTESIVQESLKLFSDKTIITIAHRLSTIKDSDKIVVIDNYTIAEQGTHDELMVLNGIYKSLQK